MNTTPAPIVVVVQNGGWDAASVVTLIVSVLALLAAFGSIVYARKWRGTTTLGWPTSRRPRSTLASSNGRATFSCS